jgi:hypothetical protein
MAMFAWSAVHTIQHKTTGSGTKTVNESLQVGRRYPIARGAAVYDGLSENTCRGEQETKQHNQPPHGA